jgi:putative toxin-antitoxin system antitoxin component (TIGR02293 family)
MPLTDEQKTEIEQEVSRVLEIRRSNWVALDTTQVEPLVRVIARAVEVLGTSDKALRWINAPVRSLNNRTPASLLNTREGIERVEDALGRIEHGVW